jgi:tetratricopeptide (TPR) repeat protein
MQKPEKAAPAAEKPPRKIPRTQVETLRLLLRDLELRIARLSECNSDDAIQILTWLDQAATLLSGLHQAGAAPGGENSCFETVKAQFHSKRRLFVNRVGGRAALEEARQEHRPPEHHWWWFSDQEIAQERRVLLRRVLVIGSIMALLLAGFWVLYQRFWKPDPALQASVGFRTMAENALIGGSFEEALSDVNQALASTPDNASLLTLRGVIYEALEEPELAADDFELAIEGYPSADRFLAERAGFYLMASLPEQALADAEAVIEINQDSVIGFMRKAQAFEMLGDIATAIEYYELASDVAERTDNPQLQVMALMRMGQLLQAAPAMSPQPTE